MVDVLRSLSNTISVELNGKQHLFSTKKLQTNHLEWVEGYLSFVTDSETSDKDIILFCIEETRKQALGKTVLDEAKFEITLEKLNTDKSSITGTLYRQYLVYKNGKYPLVDATLKITRFADGMVRVNSSIVPETARVDIPEDTWWHGARDISVGRHPYASDPYDFWITFQKGIYKSMVGDEDEEEVRIAFVDSRGNVLSDGRTNDFLGLKRSYKG